MTHALRSLLLLTTFGTPLLQAQEDDAFRDKEPFRDKIVHIKRQKLEESLELRSEQQEPFTKVYDGYSGNRRKLNQERKDLVKKLAHMSALGKEDISGDRILKTIEAINDIDTKLLDERKKAVQGLRNVLDEPQLAKFILFEQRFPVKLRDMMFDLQLKRKMGKDMPPFSLPPEDDLLD